MPAREFALSVLGGLVFLLVVAAVIGALHWNNRQHHERSREKVEACRSVEDPHARAMCVVALDS